MRKPEGKSYLEDLDIDRTIIKRDFKEIGWASMDWIHLAQDRDKWQAVVNMVMNVRVP